MREFRVIIFTAKPAAKIVRFVERVRQELPDVTGIAILYELRPGKTIGKRLNGILHRMWEPHYLPYALQRFARFVLWPVRRAGSALLRILHACPHQPNEPRIETIDGLREFAKKNGIPFLLSPDIHAEASLNFARGFRPDMGIIFGTGILKRKLFGIPRLGSVNVHKHAVPDYLGGGPTGLWELLDGKTEIGITVHEVTEQLDRGPVLRTATIPIDPFDGLDSLGLKADLVGNDILLQTVQDLIDGTAQPRKQTGEGRMYRNPSDYKLLAYRRELGKKLRQFLVPRSRPVWKLMLRTVVLFPFLAVRNWLNRARQSFPVVILYHHLITDKPHHLGLPTAEFERQVKFLRKYYHIASLPEAMHMLEEGKVKAPTVVLTFDDGYAQNYVNLRAVTEEHRIPVFLFVSTAHVSHQDPFGHDTRRSQEGFAPLSWGQIMKLRSAGFSFGSHTRTHFDCGSTDPEALRNEIVDSRSELERRLGEPIDYFSFPWGMPANMSEPAKKMALETYSYSYDAAGGINQPGAGTRRILHRCDHPFNLWDLELLLQSALELSGPAEIVPQASNESGVANTG